MRAILTYHSIDPSDSPISIAEPVFRRQVEWLASGRVKVVSLEELLRLPAEAEAVAITFDDGFENFSAIAAPLLTRHRLPVTLFVVTDRAGETNQWGGQADPRVPTLPLMDWPTLGRWSEAGVKLGGHTKTHPHLTQLGSAELEEQVAGSADRIRHETGGSPFAFAYPYGSVDARVAAVAARFYGCACGTELRALGSGDQPHKLPRLDMYYFRRPGRLEAWGSPSFHRYLWLRARARSFRHALAGKGISL